MDYYKVSKYVQDAVEAKVFPSAAFAIGTPLGILYEDYIETDAGTLYDMASITKIMVTTALCMRFLEMGRLSVHEPVSAFFDVPEDKAEISLQHLLTHTSGLPAHVMLSDMVQDPARVVECISNLPLENPVGEENVYSCLGFILLGKILEKIGGDSLDSLAERYIFRPNGMTDTMFNPTARKTAPTEHGTGFVHDENAYFLGGVSGNAGLFSTLRDAARFTQLLARDRGGLFSPAAKRTFIRNYTTGKKESRGLGFSIYDGRPHPLGDLFSYGSFGHTGFTGTSMFIDKETGLFVVLLTNRVFYGRDNNQIIYFRRRFHNFVYGIWSTIKF